MSVEIGILRELKKLNREVDRLKTKETTLGGSHAAVTLGANNNASLTLVGQELTLSSNLIDINSIQFNLSPIGVTPTEGLMYWNVDEGTVNIGMPGGNVNLQIGQEIIRRVYNDTGSDMTNGQLVYISSSTGAKLKVSLAKADSAATCSPRTLYMLTEDIADKHYGYCTWWGDVHDVNTNGIAAGTVLWLSASTAGAYTQTKPTAPNYKVKIGGVLKEGLANGIVTMSQYNGGELNDNADVQISSPSAGQALIYNAGGYWTNSSSSGVTGGGTLNRIPIWTGATTLGDTYLSSSVSGGVATFAGAIDAGGRTYTLPDASGTFELRKTNTIIVDAGGKGDYTTIKSAIEYVISQTPSASNTWLIIVRPGQYSDTHAANVPIPMPSYTTIAGSGKDSTQWTLVDPGSGGHTYNAVYSASVDAVLRDIHIVGGKPSFGGVGVVSSAEVYIYDCKFSHTSGTASYGLWCDSVNLYVYNTEMAASAYCGLSGSKFFGCNFLSGCKLFNGSTNDFAFNCNFGGSTITSPGGSYYCCRLPQVDAVASPTATFVGCEFTSGDATFGFLKLRGGSGTYNVVDCYSSTTGTSNKLYTNFSGTVNVYNTPIGYVSANAGTVNLNVGTRVGTFSAVTGVAFFGVTGAFTYSPHVNTAVPMTLKGLAGQTGDLLQFQDSSATVLARFNENAYLGLGADPSYRLHVDNSTTSGLSGWFTTSANGGVSEVGVNNQYSAAGSTDETARIGLYQAGILAGAITSYRESDFTSDGNKSGGIKIYTISANVQKLDITIEPSGSILINPDQNSVDFTLYSPNYRLIKTVGADDSIAIAENAAAKLGFFGATPIVQPTTGVAGATFVRNGGNAINDASTFDGYTVGQVVKALRDEGLLA